MKTAFAEERRRGPDARAAGHAAGLRAGADLGARQRLPQALAQGHRQPRRERRAARRDRDARDRPAALAGGRRAPAGGGRAWRSRRARSSAGKRCARRTRSRSRSSTSAAAPTRRRAPTSPRPTRTSSGCARCEGFKRVVAPFSGVITRRNVDVGDLIDAGGGAGRTLFVLTQTDPLRVYVNVPQSYAQLRQAGPEGDRHAGRAARPDASRARSRAPRRRSTRRRARCRSRSRCRTATACCCPAPTCRSRCRSQASQALTIPTNALLIRGEGMRVAVVDAARHASQLRPIKVGRNFGESVEVLDGVDAERPARAQSVRFADRGRSGGGRAAPRRAGRAAEQRRGQVSEVRRVRMRAAAAGARALLLLPAAPPGPTTASRRSRCRSTWKVEAPWRAGTPNDARAQGPVVAALRRSRSSTRCSAQALAEQPDARRWPARGWRRRARSLAAAVGGAVSAGRPRARAPRAQRISANRPLTNYASPNFSTVQNDFVLALDGQLRARPRRPRAAHDRRRARVAPSSRRPISRTPGCC